jgi:hypothetical protein
MIIVDVRAYLLSCTKSSGIITTASFGQRTDQQKTF